ncbi:hypothetical protein KSS87_000010 [Heliosperma pusillum]|nr:hypothetical protein KSS87_000010 [Heliosperma pusillum]
MSRDNIEHNGNSEALNSPFSRIYLLPQTEQILNCAMGLKNPIDIDALKKAFSNSIMLKHPRFCSLMVKDRKGVDRWKKTHVNIDDHVIIHPEVGEKDQETELNAYLADISVSTPLSKNKPLWEIHVLKGMNCVVLRVHHALGDGASLMSMLSACFGKKGVDNNHNNNVSKDDNNHAIKKRMKNWKEKSIWGFIKTLWFTIVFGLRLLGKVLWVKDMESVISGGQGVELWPRVLVTAKFKLDDFKFVKMAIPFATVNDVLLGLISAGLSKYIEVKYPTAMLQALKVTGVVVVNLRKNSAFQALTMHLVSYGGNADLQVMVAKDIIHDPQFLANCFQESLAEMKNYITVNQKKEQISIFGDQNIIK